MTFTKMDYLRNDLHNVKQAIKKRLDEISKTYNRLAQLGEKKIEIEKKIKEME